jgi:hypothetical protein
MTTVELNIPFGLTRDEIKLDPASRNSIISNELEWLTNNATEEELPRILLSAVILHEVGGFHIADCLHTAIIWERG